MKTARAIGNVLKNFFIIFSFIVNLILVLVVVVLVLTIFEIKNNLVTPLVAGLHSSFVGLDESTIDWTIPVRDRIPVRLNIPLETDTIVTLTDNVPLFVQAAITLPGGGGNLSATVNLTLPRGLELPVALDLDVPVDEMLDIALDVRAVIPISETQLHDPINNLRLTFEPIVRALYNLPDDFASAVDMAGAALAGRGPDLLAANAYSDDPWPGYSETAGVGYTLGTQPVPIANQPLVTGLVVQGGIPALDAQLRPELYANGSSPAELNAQASARMSGYGVPPYTYDGSYAQAQQAQFGAVSGGQEMLPTAVTIPDGG